MGDSSWKMEVKMTVPHDGPFCRWSQTTAGAHQHTIQHAREKLESFKLQQQQDHDNCELRTIKLGLTLKDEHGLERSRERFHLIAAPTETSSLHPHYCLARPSTVLDTELNHGFGWNVEHRVRPSGSEPRYASLRDSRDLMAREMPVLQHRLSQSRAVQDKLLHDATSWARSIPAHQLAAAVPAPEPPSHQPDLSQAAEEHANAAGPRGWREALMSDQEWLDSRGH